MVIQFLRGLAERYGEWQRRNRAYQELYALDDRSLADIGITRSEIPYVMARDPVAAVPPAGAPVHGFRHAA